MRRFVLLILSLSVYGIAQASEVTGLRCEMLVDPIGIDVTDPRLSWIIESDRHNVVQQSYRIMASSSREKMNRGEYDRWDTGEVFDEPSTFVRYEGEYIKARDEVFWKVEVRTNQDEVLVSPVARFTIGLLSPSQWFGSWIGLDRSFEWDSETEHSRLSARYFRKEFQLNRKIASAKVYLSGLGLYELYINGKRVGDYVLTPGPTDYEKTVFYNVYEVTDYLRSGKNVIGTILGNGRFYNMRQNFKPHKIKTFGYPKMILQLEVQYTDGTSETILSDRSWKVTADGPIRSNNDFDGEEYDATKELHGWSEPGYRDRDWLEVEFTAPPAGRMRVQMNENMKVMDTLRPVGIAEVEKGVYILDMGQNMTGWLQLTASGERGDRIVLRFAEVLDAEGRLNTAGLRSARATDIYTLSGQGEETWEPRFVTHGFRYVEVTGFPGVPTPENFLGKVIYDDIKTIGSFECSNPVLNRIYRNAVWGISSNYKGIPLDCPQRDERQPWLGDHAVGCFGESFIFDNERLYIKWMDDIRNSQTREGQLSDIAPPYYMTYYSDNLTWPAAYFFVGEMLFRQFGNPDPIIDHYPNMKKFLFYMKDRYMNEEYIVTKDKYGDWCVPPESPELIHTQDPARKTDGQLIATAYFYKLLTLMEGFAVIADHPKDRQEYRTLGEEVREAFHRRFYDPQEGIYGNGTVTSNLLPLAFGMVPAEVQDRVFGNMVDRIARNDNFHISTGVIGTQWLMRELTKRGRIDVAYTIATQTGYPGWGYMAEKGATTIWELWNGDTADPKMNSHNHVMLLGDLIPWMYEDLAGIRSFYGSYYIVDMAPKPTEDLTWVKASYESHLGTIASEWKIEEGDFVWNVRIPVDAFARLHIPTRRFDDIRVNGLPPLQVDQLSVDEQADGWVLIVGSGDYLIECPYGVIPDRWKSGIVEEMFIDDDPPYLESHAATVVETKEGPLAAAWFGGTKERNPDVSIWLSRLIDGQWTRPEPVADGTVNDTLRYPTWNPVLFQVPDGELQLYYKVGPTVAEWRGKMIVSRDGGRSWSEPRDLPDSFLGPVKNKPVLLSDGTLLAPSSSEHAGWKVHFEASRDMGDSWEMIGPINDGVEFSAIQPSVLFHADGSLQMLCRTQQRALGESWSYDNGRTWNPMKRSSLPSTNSGTDGVTLRDGRQLMVYNHVIPHDSLPRGKSFRSPLNVALSRDGKTWYASLVLEDSPIGQYSYPSVIQGKDGMVHVVYTWRRKKIKYVRIDPQKLLLSEIKGTEWPVR